MSLFSRMLAWFKKPVARPQMVMVPPHIQTMTELRMALQGGNLGYLRGQASEARAQQEHLAHLAIQQQLMASSQNWFVSQQQQSVISQQIQANEWMAARRMGARMLPDGVNIIEYSGFRPAGNTTEISLGLSASYEEHVAPKKKRYIKSGGNI